MIGGLAIVVSLAFQRGVSSAGTFDGGAGIVLHLQETLLEAAKSPHL